MNLNFIVCHYCQTHIDAFIDGTLHLRARRRVGRHIDNCTACYRVYVNRRELRRELQASMPLVGRDHIPDFDRMWGAIRAELPRSRPRYTQFRYGLVMLLLLLVMVVPFMLGNSDLTRTPPDQPRPHTETLTETPERGDPPATAVASATQNSRDSFNTPPTLPEPDHGN